MKHPALAAISVISLVLLAATVFCAANGKMEKAQTEQRVVELDGAKLVRVNLKSADASIKVRPGAEKLLDGRFTYSPAALKPELHYEVNQGVGELTLRHPSLKNFSHRSYVQNEWDLSLNGSVPMDMSVTSASGDCGFDLSRLSVTRLKAVTASGDIALDVPGDHQQLSALDIQTASGDIAAALNGYYSSLSGANLKSASGNIALDLSGDWAKDATIRVKTASGDITVKLPSKVGARVFAKTLSGDVTAPGLNTVDGARVNPAYGHTKATLNISVECASGDIKLQVVD